MKYLVLFFALLCSTAAFAQQGTDTQIRYGTTNPSACLPHALFANTTSNPTVLYLCTATNTWVAIATASNITLTQVGPGTAGAGTYDFSGVTLLKMRFSAGLTTSTNGDFGVDTTGKNLHVYLNGADTIIPSVSGSWVNGNCGSIVFSGGQYAILDNGSPCGSGTTSAWSTLTASTNTHAGSFLATGNTWDFTGTTLFKLRVGSTLTTSANGDLAYDTTNKNWHAWQNAVDSFMFSGPVSATYTNGDCVKFVVTANVITLADATTVCGGVQLAADLGNTNANPQVISTHLASALPVNQGGTGQATLTNHGVVVGGGTSPVSATAAGNAGQPFLSGGASANGAYGDAPVIGTAGVYGIGAAGTADVGLSRDSADTVDCGNGTAADKSCTLKLGTVITGGTNGGFTGTEGTGAALTPSTSVDTLWPDSTGQRWGMNNHNAGKVYVVGQAAAGTPGNCKAIASNGYDDVDTGASCGGLSGLVTGVIPQAGSPTTLVNSSPQLDNGVTTANTLTYAGVGGMVAGVGTTGVLYTKLANQNIEIGSGNGSGDDGGTGTVEIFKPVFPTMSTLTNCSSSASPAACAAAASGSVALPTGTNPTLVVNTTAVTANSQILLTVDESLGTKLSVTCNTTLSTLLNPVVTARTAGTSFTFTIGAIIASNPACISYTIIN